MKTVFWIFIAVYLCVEAFILLQLYWKRNKVNLKRATGNFTAGSLLLIAIWLFKIDIPYPVLIFYLVTLLISSFVGYFLDFYNKSIRFDRYLHGYGSFTFSLLGYFIIIHFVKSGGSPIYQAFFILFLGISIGAAFEIMEFTADSRQKGLKTRRTAMQKGLRDTNLDLIFNLIGSACGALFAYFIYLI